VRTPPRARACGALEGGREVRLALALTATHDEDRGSSTVDVDARMIGTDEGRMMETAT